MLTQNDPESKAQIVYFSHGGGPLPILGDSGHRAMVDFMRQLPSRLKRPEAILVISAHWEESTATLLGAQTPSMFYDYYGFPAAAYEITYPAPGSPVTGGSDRRIIEQKQYTGSHRSSAGIRPWPVYPAETDVPPSRYSVASTFAFAGS